MATKLGRMVTYLEGLLPVTLLDVLVSWSAVVAKSRDKLNHVISTSIMLMATKLGREGI